MDTIRLKAGALSASLDPHDGFLRNIRDRQCEILRGIFPALRDQNWDTVPGEIRDLTHHQDASGFRVTWTAQTCDDRFPYRWEGEITGRADGVITYDFRGEATGDLRKNRIGLCVLHPLTECVGRPCQIEHTDGRSTDGKFPELISPHQPFQDIHAINHTLPDGTRVSVEFAGEIFEMEDQRNWTDASFKTYSTPLDLPFPVQLSAGDRVDHRVTVRLLDQRKRSTPDAQNLTVKEPPSVGSAAQRRTIACRVDWHRSRVRPPIGLGMSTEPAVLTPQANAILRSVPIDHLRVDLRMDQNDWRDEASTAVRLAGQIGTRLEVAAHLTADQTGAIKPWLRDHAGVIAHLLVFDAGAKATTGGLAAEIPELLDGLPHKIKVAVGTDAYFAELNRHRPPVQHADAVAFSINPQVHAFDHQSLCETLQAQPSTIDTADTLFQRPAIVSPITLRPRFNPNATVPQASPVPETDARQSTDFAAAWTVGSLAQLATHRRCDGLTFFETVGPRGVVSMTGQPYPVLTPLRWVSAAASVAPAGCDADLWVRAVGLIDEDGSRRVLLANLCDESLSVELKRERAAAKTIELEPVSIRLLEAEQWT